MERRRSSRLGRGDASSSTAAPQSGPTAAGSSSLNATTKRIDANDDAAASKAASSRSKAAAAPPSSSSSKGGRQGNKKRTTRKKQPSNTLDEPRAPQPPVPASQESSGSGSSKRRKLTTDAGNKRVAVTPSPVAAASSSSCAPSKGPSSKPVGKSIKDALRQEAQEATTATDDQHDVDARPPPEGVFDLEATAAANLKLRTATANSQSDDNTNSFLTSYGRRYYRHLFDSAARLGDTLAGTTEEVVREGGGGTFSTRLAAAAKRVARLTGTATTASSSSGRLLLPRCLTRQTDISCDMRAILVDWLAELSHSFKLQDVTLHLSVELLDRTLCEMNVERRTFQCLGCACMLIASKLEETQPVTTKDLAYMSDSTYTRSEIKDMEVKVCDLLGFRLQTSTAHHFFHRFQSASDATAGLSGPHPCSPPNPILQTMVSYLMELSLLDYSLVETRNCLVAASALYLARATLGIRDEHGRVWNGTLKYYTSYDVEDLEDTVLALHACQSNADQSSLKCVVTHYKHKDRFEVARKPALLLSDLGFNL